MTLPVHSTSASVSSQEDDRPPVKRPKTTAFPSPTAACSIEKSTFVRRHPLGVRPSGNSFTSDENLKLACGGFRTLPDELLAQCLEVLDAPDLLRLGACCRALHAFTRNEELWRALFVESPPTRFHWKGTWRSTFLSQSQDREPHVDCANLFSDVLHRPFLCAHIPLHHFADKIPKQNQVPRLEDISYEEFASTWFDRPFILTTPVKEWPIYQSWSIEHLLSQYGNVAFRAEAVDWTLRGYVEYMNNSHDESPLYLFDRSFAEKMRLNATIDSNQNADYWPPKCFGPDVFTVLGDKRPDHRWLIVGPDRSGSTFHKDPNATSAWNAVLKGRKYWIMFPSSPSIPPPPGVYVSEDQSEVTSPLSIAEWLLGFHAEARATPGCQEGLCEEGEVFYVPSGWYHLVLNLEASIALTQNFIPRSRVGTVLHFLRDQKQSISGFGDDVEDPYALFVERLRQSDPLLLEQGLLDLERLASNGTRWERLTRITDEDPVESGFSFGFGGADSDEEVP